MSKKKWVLLVVLLIAAVIGIFLDSEKYTIFIAHIGILPAVAYPLVYRGLPWKQTSTGRALMNHARANALLFTIPLLGYWWPFPGFSQIYAAIVTYLVWSIGYQLLVLRRVKREGQAKREAQQSVLAEEGAQT